MNKVSTHTLKIQTNARQYIEVYIPVLFKYILVANIHTLGKKNQAEVFYDVALHKIQTVDLNT